METYLTTEDVLGQLDISESTLKNWVKMFQLEPQRGPRNKKRYDPDTFEMLQIVKNLRDEERSFETIRRVITTKSVPQDQVSPPHQAGTSLVPKQPEQAMSLLDKQDMVSEVVKAIQEQTALSEKYARATYTIGQLEAEKKSLEAQVQTLKHDLADKQGKLVKFKKHWFVRLFLGDYD